MAALVWDKPGERIYHTGIDRGVLYLHDGTVAVWNGLTKVEDASDAELKSFYLDGVKYLQTLIPGDFSGKLSAFTYPEEFDVVNGIVDVAPGLEYHDQPAMSFNISYRTKIGDDIEGIDHGYKIHILYNVIANPDSYSFDTLKASGVEPIEFSWSLSGTPQKVVRAKPTVHITIDSLDTPPEILQLVEDTLYGTNLTDASLPSMLELSEYFGYRGALLIVDYGSGMWSAIDESDTYITMLDDTTFQIAGADATFLDADTYKISSTNIS